MLRTDARMGAIVVALLLVQAIGERFFEKSVGMYWGRFCRLEEKWQQVREGRFNCELNQLPINHES